MKDISSIEKSKDVISGLHVSKEGLYYIALFGAASITAAVLLIIAYVQHNSPLKIYSFVLLPLFLILTAVAARFTYVTKNRVYVKDGTLVIKSFFLTRKLKTEKIDKLTAAKNGETEITSVNITYCTKTYKYKFKNFTKEDISHLRRVTSK